MGFPDDRAQVIAVPARTQGYILVGERGTELQIEVVFFPLDEGNEVAIDLAEGFEDQGLASVEFVDFEVPLLPPA